MKLIITTVVISEESLENKIRGVQSQLALVEHVDHLGLLAG